MTTIEHVRACWPTGHINGATHHVADWCGWTFDEALANLFSLRVDGLISGHPAEGEIHTRGPHAGKPFWFWMRPDGAHGLPPLDDPRLASIGVLRATRDGNLIKYQGLRPLDVYRLAKKEGYLLSGYSLDWHGPDPTGRQQLDIPIGFAP